MTTVTLSEAKAKLSAVLRRVKRGETILITERGRPVARIEPARPSDESIDARIRRLEEAGVVTPPRRPMSRRAWLALLTRPGPPDPHGAVRRALREDRDESR